MTTQAVTLKKVCNLVLSDTFIDYSIFLPFTMTAKCILEVNRPAVKTRNSIISRCCLQNANTKGTCNTIGNSCGYNSTRGEATISSTLSVH